MSIRNNSRYKDLAESVPQLRSWLQERNSPGEGRMVRRERASPHGRYLLSCKTLQGGPIFSAGWERGHEEKTGWIVGSPARYQVGWLLILSLAPLTARCFEEETLLMQGVKQIVHMHIHAW